MATPKKTKKAATKKPSARSAINAAIKAVKKGTVGSTARLQKAITTFAAKSCSTKKAAVSGTKKKATKSKAKKRTTKRK